MITNDFVLEAHNIYHTAEVVSGDCFSGNKNSALVLKGVNLVVHSGEVLAILGSKGSGKKALLDVISRRTKESSRGQVLLNGAAMTKSLFGRCCGYVTHENDFIPGLTAFQTLQYTPTVSNGFIKQSKVRQVLADLTLSQVANKKVENLNVSEKRRLAIGVQLIRDPVMLLLDEPTQGLDPLSAYLLISILSNSAKKLGCGIILSLEKPRSDVFPFLDRALFLCLGGAVYSGGTRAMLEYFHGIGFPCPQLENPLMYYLCLSTVDRRSRDRFLESSQQIEALVQRFARESPLNDGPIMANGFGKLPLSYAKPGVFNVWGLLFLKMLAVNFSCGSTGLKSLFLRLLALPLAIGSMWIFYSNIGDDSKGFYSKNGMILNVLGISYGCGILTTMSIFPQWRKRFYHDAADGLYSGVSLLLAYNAVSIPFSIISAAIATSILYPIILNPFIPIHVSVAYLFVAIWSCYFLAEQLCVLFCLFIKSRINVAVAVSYIVCICVALSSGTVRSFKGLHPFLQDYNKIVHTKYASALLHSAVFLSRNMKCEQTATVSCPVPADYLVNRIGEADIEENHFIVIAVVIPVALSIFNMILYTLPIANRMFRKHIEK
ncbi:hypothetical protein HA402_009597 [Bradysia odoriphaga]|nr:hypothetical protein HA402_009597 [Bradysia odoriphaga]